MVNIAIQCLHEVSMIYNMCVIDQTLTSVVRVRYETTPTDVFSSKLFFTATFPYIICEETLGN